MKIIHANIEINIPESALAPIGETVESFIATAIPDLRECVTTAQQDVPGAVVVVTHHVSEGGGNWSDVAPKLGLLLGIGDISPAAILQRVQELTAPQGCL